MKVGPTLSPRVIVVKGNRVKYHLHCGFLVGEACCSREMEVTVTLRAKDAVNAKPRF